MARAYDEAVGSLTDANKKAALKELKDLRSGHEPSYAGAINEIFDYLEINSGAPTEEYGKGLIITLITHLFGYGERRDVTLNALGLIEGYEDLPITQRRIKFIEDMGYVFTPDAL